MNNILFIKSVSQ